MEKEKILNCKNLTKYFFLKNKVLKAVDNISFSITKGKTLGLVGESGCGKSTLAKLILKLLKPTNGEILFENSSVFSNNLHQKMQMVFQDPYLSLNPTMTVEEIILEPLKIHKKLTKQELNNFINELLDKVHLPRYIKNRLPHEFSGGQRQRIAIARSICLTPSFIVCDEILSSLDISISSQIIHLLISLQKTYNLTYLFISHNLSTIKYLSDEIAVMYQGRFVEYGSKKDIFENPLHPYTKALFSKKASLIEEKLKNSNGCLFAPKCPVAKKMCFETAPELSEKANNHLAACHFIKTDSKSIEGRAKTTFSSL